MHKKCLKSFGAFIVQIFKDVITLFFLFHFFGTWLSVSGKVKYELRVTSLNPRLTSSNSQARRIKARVRRLKARVEAIKPRVR